MKELRGKNALLTGGSRGLGPLLARALAREGVNLALGARGVESLNAVAAEMRALGVNAVAIAVDVTDAEARSAAVERTRAELGSIDILINNAGIEWISSYAALSPNDIENMVQTNLISAMVLARLVLPGMLDLGRGHILNMASLAGKKGSPYSATYSGTKAALIEWSAGLREELRGSGVGVSAVCPGFVADEGMFADYGEKAPWVAGQSKPQEVVSAVMRAIKNDLGEIIVNPGPTRLLVASNAISPRFTSWALRTAGLYEFFRRQAVRNENSLRR